jgi:hypothetical protein
MDVGSLTVSSSYEGHHSEYDVVTLGVAGHHGPNALPDYWIVTDESECDDRRLCVVKV